MKIIDDIQSEINRLQYEIEVEKKYIEGRKANKREAKSLSSKINRLENLLKLKDDNMPSVRVNRNYNGKLDERRLIETKKEIKRNTINRIRQERLETETETKSTIHKINKDKKINIKKEPIRKKRSGKPKIMLITDVNGWAWSIKSKYIVKYLSDEFDFDIFNFLEDGRRTGIDRSSHDLYFTFGYSYIDKISHIEKNRRITGVTAHRTKNLIKSKMKLAGHVHANSIMLVNELKSMGFDNVYYLPNGVDENLFYIKNSIPEQRENIIVGHVGKLSPRKGQNQYIKPAIKESNAESFLHLNNYRNRIDHNKMVDVYQKMDVFIVASDEDGTPNPALEAAACGRPIISNRIGNMPEFIKDGYNGFLVEKDVDAYVDKINWFRDNRDKMIEMGMNARKTIEEDWTWKIQSERYRNMFRDILEKIQ